MSLVKDYTAEDLQNAFDKGRATGREEALAQPEQEPVACDSEMKSQAKQAYPHDEKRELAFIDGWLSREATQHQNPATTDWGAVHDKLMGVWHRELSADEGLDEIQGLINTTPPQRTWVGLTDELSTLKAVSDEYNAWIRYHAGGGSYDDFLANTIAAHGINEKNT